MNLFTKSISATALKEKSTKILGIFTKTVEDLKKINESADAEIVAKEAIIKEAETERLALQNLTVENNKIIQNINTILK